MLNKLRERRDNESGFTLIELLVVILIIGILAAIALPAFLGQQAKGQDSSAKSNARNAVSDVESFYASNNTYTGYTLATSSGLPTTGDDAVSVSVQAKSYVITAKSKSGNEFYIKKANAGTTDRSCKKGSGDTGGCTTAWGTVVTAAPTADS